MLARKDIATSYHIAVVVDDAAQGVTDVVRGEDLLMATSLHRFAPSATRPAGAQLSPPRLAARRQRPETLEKPAGEAAAHLSARWPQRRIRSGAHRSAPNDGGRLRAGVARLGIDDVPVVRCDGY